MGSIGNRYTYCPRTPVPCPARQHGRHASGRAVSGFAVGNLITSGALASELVLYIAWNLIGDQLRWTTRHYLLLGAKLWAGLCILFSLYANAR